VSQEGVYSWREDRAALQKKRNSAPGIHLRKNLFEKEKYAITSERGGFQNWLEAGRGRPASTLRGKGTALAAKGKEKEEFSKTMSSLEEGGGDRSKKRMWPSRKGGFLSRS